MTYVLICGDKYCGDAHLAPTIFTDYVAGKYAIPKKCDVILGFFTHFTGFTTFTLLTFLLFFLISSTANQKNKNKAI